MRLFTYELVLPAPPEVVYEHLVQPAGLTRWIAQSAVSEAVPGGEIRWRFEDGSTMLGRYVDLEPPRRVVMRYGWEHTQMGVPPESTLVEIELTEHADGTALRLVHSLLPGSAIDRHRHGWEFFLRRLQAALGSPGAFTVDALTTPAADQDADRDGVGP